MLLSLVCTYSVSFMFPLCCWVYLTFFFPINFHPLFFSNRWVSGCSFPLSIDICLCQYLYLYLPSFSICFHQLLISFVIFFFFDSLGWLEVYNLLSNHFLITLLLPISGLNDIVTREQTRYYDFSHLKLTEMCLVQYSQFC